MMYESCSVLSVQREEYPLPTNGYDVNSWAHSLYPSPKRVLLFYMIKQPTCGQSPTDKSFYPNIFALTEL